MNLSVLTVCIFQHFHPSIKLKVTIYSNILKTVCYHCFLSCFCSIVQHQVKKVILQKDLPFCINQVKKKAKEKSSCRSTSSFGSACYITIKCVPHSQFSFRLKWQSSAKSSLNMCFSQKPQLAFFIIFLAKAGLRC